VEEITVPGLPPASDIPLSAFLDGEPEVAPAIRAVLSRIAPAPGDARTPVLVAASFNSSL
jgi:hypothetical protein